jgi:hypothetical protein
MTESVGERRKRILLWIVFILLIVFFTLLIILFLVGWKHQGSSYLNQCFLKYGETCSIFQENKGKMKNEKGKRKKLDEIID